MIDLIKVLVLGVVEGLTEFLPISSTGHLIVVASLLNFNRMSGTFEIFIQVGAVVAVIAYYWSDLWQQVRTVHRDAGIRRFWLAIVIAFIPAAVMGILLNDWIQEVLFHPGIVAMSLIIGGILFILIEKREITLAQAETKTLTDITVRQALAIGIAQTIALVPGVSRSGASIIGGMLSGLNRQVATQFSFYLAIPTLGGATVYELLTSLDELKGDDLVFLLVGAFISGIVAWLSIRWLLRYVAGHDFVLFGYYRILVGAIIILLIIGGVLT